MNENRHNNSNLRKEAILYKEDKVIQFINFFYCYIDRFMKYVDRVFIYT